MNTAAELSYAPRRLKLLYPGRRIPVRSSADTDAEKIGFVCDGDEFVVVGETRNGFFILEDSKVFYSN